MARRDLKGNVVQCVFINSKIVLSKLMLKLEEEMS